MSDYEDDIPASGGAVEENEEVEAEYEEEQEERPRKSSRRDYDEDEDEEDEEEEDPGADRGKKRRRTKRPAVNRFLDVEAEVDEDEDEEEDEDEYARDEFVVGGEAEEDDVTRRAADHARFDRRERELNDQDLAKIAENLNQRYKRTAKRFTSDAELPQRMLMPSVEDPSLWQVRVRPGKERDLVFSLMRKALDLEFSNRPLQVLSAFQRPQRQQVSDACNGLVGVFPSRGIVLVPIDEMASLLQIKKQDLTVTPGSWVRIKRGKYQGDLAQVMDITENGEEVGLKFIPRIDLNPKDDAALDATGKKRKKGPSGLSSFSMRPPQRFFNYEEAVKVYGRKAVSKRNQVYVFQNDTYRDGFIEKDFRLTALQLDDVSPTLDEITRFTRGQDGTENDANVDLSIIAEASRKAAISVLQPGDHVEVFEGEQAGVHGTVHSIEQDIVSIQSVGMDLEGQRIQLPARSVRKRFKAGDHVKVMTGQNADETGLVVSVVDNVVTFLSDMSMQEVSVFSKDLREAAEVGTGTNVVGNYELHDLVQLDLQTVGVIFKTERDSFRVLDQNGQVRLVQPHQISMRRDSNRAIATDAEGHELRVNDNVKEIDGEARKGRVLHTYQSFFAFLHNRDYNENGGVFVTRARSLVSLAPKGNAMKLGTTDLSKMNPALNGGVGGMVGSGNMGRGPRDRLIGVTVTVTKGPNKGYVGTIKDTNGPIARVELVTGNKVISIDKAKLMRRNQNGALEPLEGLNNMGPPRGGFNANGGRTPNPYAGNGGRTPAWGAVGRTPNPYANGGGKTPHWGSGQTPGWEKTPAWPGAGATPHQFGDKTPAWPGAGRTPNPYTQNQPKTPRWDGSAQSPTGGQAKSPERPQGSGHETPRRAWGSEWEDLSYIDNPQQFRRPAGEEATSPAANPYTGAPTPGVHDLYNDFRTPNIATSMVTPGPSAADFNINVASNAPFELSDQWLLEPEFSSQRGMLVDVKGSFGPSGWFNGDYEGKQGIVVSVFDTKSANFAATANVRFLEPLDPAKPSLQVPVEVLKPVNPEKYGTEVLILHGPHKGQQARVNMVEAGGLMVVTTRQFTVDELGAEKLVVVRPVD
ncbi:uncharacterized protein B0H18DRAFT_989959 [Fomitopsis serialis]|uniref:uncharacterized protein n=1 Tax=Fomitopsis serialis TaxID=139415 RepID=UPI002008D844|nr:uncharacterized protein B0H18DRAFT_989959 [Neoantrodia serialis]KAH9931558.1 hypothetical protein B0H18DRAFT_989959 [Neoantrodia serialis]